MSMNGGSKLQAGQNVQLLADLEAEGNKCLAYLDTFQKYVNTAGNNLRRQADIVINDPDFQNTHADVVAGCADAMFNWVAERDAVNRVVQVCQATVGQARLSDRQAVKS